MQTSTSDRYVKQISDIAKGLPEEKLRKVVSEKHAGQMIQSNIICKFFLEAVRNQRYGWFWECPNGETCHYRHALPPGFVLEKKKKLGEEEDQVEEDPLEERLEEERRQLGGVGTPVTLELFTEWKAQRAQREAELAKAASDDRAKAISAGKAVNLTGRELLQFRPELFANEDPGDDGEGFDYAALRAQLLAEEDAEAAQSVSHYQAETKDFDMDVDESLFLDAAAAEQIPDE